MFVDPESRLTVLTIVKSCFLNSCCLPFVRFLANSSFFSRTVPRHTARDTTSLVERDTPAFISPDLWPPNSPDLNPVDYKVWGVMQHRIYQTQRSRMWTIWSAVWLTLVLVYSRALSTTPSTSGVNVSEPVFKPEVDTLNNRSDSRISQTLRTLIHSINITF